MKRLTIGLIGFALLLAAGCARERAVVSGDVKVTVDEGMCLSVSTPLTDVPLVGNPVAFSAIQVNGQTPAFTLVKTETKAVDDAFGKGTAFIFKGETALEEGSFHRDIT